MQGQVRFPGNPWPSGHAIAELAWSARVDEKRLHFELDLKTADYSAEGPGIEPDEHARDWAHPIVWNNCHACHLRSNGGFRAATPRAPITLTTWAGATYRAGVGRRRAASARRAERGGSRCRTQERR